jgi:glucose-1-phosphatase
MAGRPSATPVVLFDLGGVLVHVRGFTDLASLLDQAGADWSGDGQAMRSRWLASPSVRSFELGQIPPEVFAQRFVDEWRLPIEPAAFAEDFAGWIVGPFSGAEQLVADLQGRGYHVSCLSNGNALHWHAMSEFLSKLDSAFSSHLLGEIKPDEQAFLATANCLGVAPADMVFFDDSSLNIEAAERLGMRSFLVDGPNACRHALVSEGLL